MKKTLVFLFLLAAVGQARAQQRPLYTQYMINGYLLNPALSGIEDYTDVKLGTRQQWVGLEGAPETYLLSAHTPLGKQAATVRGRGPTGTRSVQNNRFSRPYAHHGVGVMAVRDKTGPLRRTNVKLSYAYHLPLTRGITMSMGASAGALRNSLNAGEATFSNPADPAISSDYVNHTYLDLGLGTWVYSDRFFVGLSGQQLLKGKRELNPSEANGTNGVLQRHYYATAGYKLRLSPGVSLIPSVMARFASPSPSALDLNLKATFADRVWAGLSYRRQDAYALMAGLNVSYLLDVSYSYDRNTSGLEVANAGSHEVVLGLKLFNKARAICPRWMQ